jgi:phage shock protein PspC (stress-responsive transcriptional regulator)
MKKNININISGIIFYIEEDGYDRLKEYLLSIHKYFSSFEDSAEIVADIENRIAEIFLAKLGDNRQVIMIEDIEELVATMGSVADFQAVEEETFGKNAQNSNVDAQAAYERKLNENVNASFNFEKDKSKEQSQTSSTQSKSTQSNYPQEEKKLLRDGKRKLLAGVASGIAHYFSIDPLWVRLLFLATLFDWLVVVSVSGVAFFSYILMWAFVPMSNELEEDARVKKLFRNPNNKVLGGVAGGLAAYFGVEVTLIRVLLVVGMFLGGSTFIAYCILWAITPEAKTLTEKMEMEGEPITLKNIEEKIKENLNLENDKEETLLAKVLLFPFRLIARIFSILTPLVKPFGNFFLQMVRVIFGGSFTVVGFIFVAAFTFVLLATTGFLNILGNEMWEDKVHFGEIPSTMILELVPMFGIYAGYVTVLIPSIALVIAGVSLIAGRKIISNIFLWSLFGIWNLSLVFSIKAATEVANKFKKTETIEQTSTYSIKDKILVVDAIQNEDKMENSDVSITVKAHDKDEIQLIKYIRANGTDKDDAVVNANMLNYDVKQEANKLIFNRYFTYKPEAVYRNQNISMTLYVPYGQEFVMTDKLAKISRNTVSPYGYERKDITNEAHWIFDKEKGLICLTCPKNNSAKSEISEISENTKKYILKEFDNLVINSSADITIERGEKFMVLVMSDSEDFDKVQIIQTGNTLVVTATDSQEPDIKIIVPSLKSLIINGESEVHIQDLKTEKLNLVLSGASEVDAQMDCNNLQCVLSGKAELRLTGTGKEANFVLDGASNLEAFDFALQIGKINAQDACNATLNVEKNLEISTSGVSEVNYRGNALVKGKGKFSKEE